MILSRSGWRIIRHIGHTGLSGTPGSAGRSGLTGPAGGLGRRRGCGPPPDRRGRDQGRGPQSVLGPVGRHGRRSRRIPARPVEPVVVFPFINVALPTGSLTGQREASTHTEVGGHGMSVTGPGHEARPETGADPGDAGIGWQRPSPRLPHRWSCGGKSLRGERLYRCCRRQCAGRLPPGGGHPPKHAQVIPGQSSTARSPTVTSPAEV